MIDIVDGLNALIKNTEGRLYDHERKFLETAVLHIQGMRAVAGKATAGPSFRDMIPLRRMPDIPSPTLQQDTIDANGGGGVVID